MRLNQAFILRVTELCERENLTLYQLSRRAGLPKSTLLSAMDPEKGNPGLGTVEAVLRGLRVSAAEFFDSELFD